MSSNMHHSLCVTFFLILVTPALITEASDPDFGASTQKMIHSRGFQYQVHNIVTVDGYILQTFRIIKRKAPSPLLPVVMVHGFLGSSNDFLMTSPGGHVSEGTTVTDAGLGFELAKQGYDVWLPNCRGNRYSQNHTKYPTSKKVNSDPRFWDFSHAGMAKKDVPAIIGYVLRATKRKSVGYIGHSRGTTVIFAALTMYPELNNQIRPVIALSPITTLRHAKGVSASPLVKALLPLTAPFNFPLLQKDSIPDPVRESFGKLDNGLHAAKLIQLSAGDKIGSINASRWPVFIGSFPVGSSAKDGRLFLEDMVSGKFSRYDYGPIQNLMEYGTLKAPEYELERITNEHIYLMKGPADPLSDPADTNRLRRKLGDRIREDIVIPDPKWGHFAMIWGQEMGIYVTDPVLRILEQYT